MLVFLLLIGVPLVELLLLIQVGGTIGALPTIAICVATGFLGASLARSQGGATLRRAQQAMNEGRVPTREMLDGLLILVAGAMLLTPGYITDTLGILLLLPPTRALIRGRLASWAKEHLTTTVRTSGPFGSTTYTTRGSWGTGASFGDHEFDEDDDGPDQEVLPPGEAPKPPKSRRGPIIIDQ